MEKKKTNWIKLGAIWGAGMYVAMTIVLPLTSEIELTWKFVLFSIPLWALGGLMFGLGMKWTLGTPTKKRNTDQSSSNTN